jgi:hypothetical protein
MRASENGARLYRRPAAAGQAPSRAPKFWV